MAILYAADDYPSAIGYRGNVNPALHNNIISATGAYQRTAPKQTQAEVLVISVKCFAHPY